MTISTKFPFLVYDDQCALCVRFKQALERTHPTQELYFISVSDPELYLAHPYLKPEECQSTLHLVESPEKIHRGAQALEYLAQQLPWCQPFLWLLESERGKKTLDYFYKKTNELREKVRRECPGCL